MKLTDEDLRIAEAVLEAFDAADDGGGYTDLYAGSGHAGPSLTIDGHYNTHVLIERLRDIFDGRPSDA